MEQECKLAGHPQKPIFNGDYSFNTGKESSLSVFDYSIVLAIAGVTLGITFYVVMKQRKRIIIDDFLLAGRDIGWVSAGLSLYAGHVSGISFIGLPILTYTVSVMEIWYLISWAIGSYLSVYTFVPLFRNLRITSQYEYLEKRFNRKVRCIGSVYFIVMTMVYLTMVMYAPCVSLTAVTKIDRWVAIVSVGVLCIGYTALGGLRNVIYTDVFQGVVMIVAVLCIFIKGLVVVGGLGPMWSSGRRRNRIIFNSSFDLKENEAFIAVLVSGFTYAFTAFGASQLNMHRFLCCRSNNDALKAYKYITLPCVYITLTGIISIGLIASAFYENCDPIQTGLIADEHQFFPLFVMDTMTDVIGLPGLFIAGILSTTLGTMSSGLNSMATATLEDFFRPFFWNRIGEGRARIMTQILTVLFGSLCLEFTFLATRIEGGIGLWKIDLAVNGLFAAPLLSVFLMGVLFPWVNCTAALWSLLGGSALNLLIIVLGLGLTSDDTSTHAAILCISNCNLTVLSKEVQENLVNPTTPAPVEGSDSNFTMPVSNRYYSFIGLIMTMAMGLLISKCTEPLLEPTHPTLIVPILDELFPFYYLPESIRCKFRYGIDHTDKWDKWYAELKARKAITE